MRITTLASVVIPCLGFSASSIAAAEDVMIVSASGYEKKLTNAAASVSVISQEELQSSQYHDLAEALRSVEGVDVESGTVNRRAGNQHPRNASQLHADTD